MKATKRENFRIEVTPRSAGDFGFASVSGMQRSEAEAERLCEDIAEQIRRHVDELPSRHMSRQRGVYVMWDSKPICSHCGSAWTEEGPYNGGCCDKDCEEEDARQAAQGAVNGSEGRK